MTLSRTEREEIRAFLAIGSALPQEIPAELVNMVGRLLGALEETEARLRAAEEVVEVARKATMADAIVMPRVKEELREALYAYNEAVKE